MRKLAWIVLAISMASCGQGTDGGDDKLGPQSAESRQAEILEKEAALKSSHDFSQQTTIAKADELVKLYRNYVSMNPTDSMSAEYLFRGADLCIGLEDYNASITMLDRLITSFPNYPRIAEIMLFKGFIYENYEQSCRSSEILQSAYRKISKPPLSGRSEDGHRKSHHE